MSSVTVVPPSLGTDEMFTIAWWHGSRLSSQKKTFPEIDGMATGPESLIEFQSGPPSSSFSNRTAAPNDLNVNFIRLVNNEELQVCSDLSNAVKN